MKNCEKLIRKIKSGETYMRVAMGEMYLNKDFQKSAEYAHRKYEIVRNMFSWEDIFSESIERFIRSVQSEKNKKTPIGNCKAFFYSICRNYCAELDRKSRIPYIEPEQNVINKDEIFRTLVSYFSKLSEQCQLLMFLLYTHHPPFDSKDKNEIAEILEEHGYKIQPESVPTVISRCKKSLKEVVANSLDEFDLF